MKDELTTKLLSTGFDVNVIPSLILSFRSDTLVRDILPRREKGYYGDDTGQNSNSWDFVCYCCVGRRSDNATS